MFAEIDASAYALWGSTYATPRTWFNQAVKNFVDVLVNEKRPMLFYDAEIDVSVGSKISLDIDAQVATGGTARCYYGTSKTALINSVACTGVAPNYLAEMSTTKGVKYFFQVRINEGESAEGVRSGIYHAVSI